MLRLRRERWRRLLREIESWLTELALKLEERGVKVDEVKLFGSFARGDYAEGSDLDLVVVSRDWEGVNYVERLSLLYKLWDKPLDANFIPLTPEELAERLEASVTLKDASKYWITIYRRDRRREQ